MAKRPRPRMAEPGLNHQPLGFNIYSWEIVKFNILGEK
jgi:hypothetical protein